MKKEESNEIEVEVIVCEPVKIRLREVIISIVITIFCVVIAYASTDYAFVVARSKLDYIIAIIVDVVSIGWIYLSVLNVRDYWNKS